MAKHTYTYKQYAENIHTEWFRCYWDPVGELIQAHGDNKNTTRGAFITKTMETTNGEYKVWVFKVMGAKKLKEVDNFEVSEPSYEEVAKVMKERVESKDHKG